MVKDGIENTTESFFEKASSDKTDKKKNTTKKACGIKFFNGNLDVPVVSAFGEGKLAEKIIEIAIENGVEIVENDELFYFEELLKVGYEIPEETYKIVANILAIIINKIEG